MSAAQPSLDDVWRLFQETDRKFQETGRLLKEQSQETDRKFQETDRKLNQLEKLFTSQWGRLMESLVEGDLVKILTQRGIPIADTTTRLWWSYSFGCGSRLDAGASALEEKLQGTPRGKRPR